MINIFDNYDLYAALEHAAKGGQAVHLYKRLSRGVYLARLFDADEQRLINTAKSLGVKVIQVQSRGTARQYIDLSGPPLRAAMARANSPKEQNQNAHL